MQIFFLSELVKIPQTHKKTMCDTLTQRQAICLRHSKQVPCLKALQKGSFPQNASIESTVTFNSENYRSIQYLFTLQLQKAMELNCGRQKQAMYCRGGVFLSYSFSKH